MFLKNQILAEKLGVIKTEVFHWEKGNNEPAKEATRKF
jgi:DNA-binding transcriptional regulator YiaG